jgi:hypothetical protein
LKAAQTVYNLDKIIVIAQMYLDEEKEYLTNKYKNVDFRWYDEKIGVVNAFETVHKIGQSFDKYIFMEDDVSLLDTKYQENPTLNQMEYVLDNNDRIGCSTVYGMSLIHFMYKCKTLVDYYFNPAQLIMFKSSATKGLSYDSIFEKFKMDTDYTMQMITKNEMFPISSVKETTYAQNALKPIEAKAPTVASRFDTFIQPAKTKILATPIRSNKRPLLTPPQERFFIIVPIIY